MSVMTRMSSTPWATRVHLEVIYCHNFQRLGGNEMSWWLGYWLSWTLALSAPLALFHEASDIICHPWPKTTIFQDIQGTFQSLMAMTGVGKLENVCAEGSGDYGSQFGLVV